MKSKGDILTEVSGIGGRFFEDLQFNDAICVNHALKAMELYAQEVTATDKAIQNQFFETQEDQKKIEALEKQLSKLNKEFTQQSILVEDKNYQINALISLLGRARTELSFLSVVAPADHSSKKLIAEIDQLNK